MLDKDAKLNLSFEFFPPKTDKAAKKLFNSIADLEPFNPKFVSVTYGAGGSTRERTHDVVSRIAQTTDIKPAAHLTCVGSSRDEINEIVDAYWDAGVHHIVALRGDPPAGIDTKYTPHPDGYAYSADLVSGLKKRHDFEISVSAYPERHPESSNWDVEIDNLKRKVDHGADRAITQFFFGTTPFLRFMDRVRDAGIAIPIVPGIMLQPNFAGMKRMSDMCGVEIPDDISQFYAGMEDNEKGRENLTAAIAIQQVMELCVYGVTEFHLYTLNRSDIAKRVSQVLHANDHMKVA